MSVSVADLVTGRVKRGLDEAAPRIGGAAMLQAIEALLETRFERTFTGAGSDYVHRLLKALDTPLPRVLVTAWRRYEELLEFAPTDDEPASSGEVTLRHQTIENHWELAPRFEDRELAGPRLVVALDLGIETGTVVVEQGRIVSLRTGALSYDGSVAVEEAPEKLATVGPDRWEVPGGLLDFGSGFPIRPGY